MCTKHWKINLTKLDKIISLKDKIQTALHGTVEMINLVSIDNKVITGEEVIEVDKKFALLPENCKAIIFHDLDTIKCICFPPTIKSKQQELKNLTPKERGKLVYNPNSGKRQNSKTVGIISTRLPCNKQHTGKGRQFLIESDKISKKTCKKIQKFKHIFENTPSEIQKKIYKSKFYVFVLFTL